ncbi:transcriptional repressor [Priestia endophytica]|uniref:transcriptional repressor n=1 Tax=Priestia endophytica TaxID=135735 RepID=UPI0016275993
MEDYKINLRGNDYKFTPKQLEILSFSVYYRYWFISVKLVIQPLQKTSGNVSLDTVYHNIFFFRDSGLYKKNFL